MPGPGEYGEEGSPSRLSPYWCVPFEGFLALLGIRIPPPDLRGQAHTRTP